MYNIYIYKLRDGDKFLLCPHFTTHVDDNVEVQMSAFLYQEIVETNPIASFHRVEEGLLGWQVDAFVHTYMHRYGIENVRGGRYNRWDLTDAQKDEISDAIKFFAFDLGDQEIKINKYCEYVKMNDDEVTLKNKIHSYELLAKDRQRFAIDRNIIFELNWLQRIIETPVEKFLEVQIRYTTLMQALSKVFAQFEREIEDATCKLPNKNICALVFSKPYTFFDCRVIPSEREHGYYTLEDSKRHVFNLQGSGTSEDLKQSTPAVCGFKSSPVYKVDEDVLLPDVIKAFELAIYTLINREDEISFEMESIDIEELRDRLFLRELAVPL